MKVFFSRLMIVVMALNLLNGCSGMENHGAASKTLSAAVLVPATTYVVVSINTAAAAALAGAVAAGAAVVVGGAAAGFAIYYIQKTDVQIPGHGYLGYYDSAKSAKGATIKASEAMGGTVKIDTVPIKIDPVAQKVQSYLASAHKLSKGDHFLGVSCKASWMHYGKKSPLASAGAKNCLAACTKAFIQGCNAKAWKDAVDGSNILLECGGAGVMFTCGGAGI